MPKTVYDLRMMFHNETGMYPENHSEEYIKWLEGSLIEKQEGPKNE